MDAKVGVQTTANYRKLTKIFLATDRDQWHNVLKEERVSHMETVWMMSCMRQVAKNAILGFPMSMSMLVNNGNGTGHKTMPKGLWKQTTCNRFTKDRDN